MWKMYISMKKILPLLIISLFTAVSLFAQKTHEVSLRFSKQDNNLRIVLESDGDLIKNSNIVTSLSRIRIEFPDRYEFKQQKDFIFEILQKDRFLVMNLKDIIDIKSYKLAAPARIVIDLKLEQKSQQETVQQTGQKIQQGAIIQTAQKTQPGVAQKAGQKIQQEGTQPAEKAHKVRTFVIDAGHGGYDYGIVSQDMKEKDFNLNLAKDLSNALLKKGQKVSLTRKVDQSFPITDRINFAIKNKLDIFISIHSSLSDKFAIYVSPIEDQTADTVMKLYSISSRQNKSIERSRDLAKKIGESVKGEFDDEVILREMPLPVLNSVEAPAVLIEYPSLKSRTYDQKMRDKLVNSILKGIAAYEQ